MTWDHLKTGFMCNPNYSKKLDAVTVIIVYLHYHISSDSKLNFYQL